MHEWGRLGIETDPASSVTCIYMYMYMYFVQSVLYVYIYIHGSDVMSVAVVYKLYRCAGMSVIHR